MKTLKNAEKVERVTPLLKKESALKTTLRLFLLTFVVGNLLGFSAPAFANNRKVVYQGRVLRPDGSALEGTYKVQIKIYSPDPKRCLLWGEEKDVSFEKGAFSVEAGDLSKRMAGLNAGGSSTFTNVFLNDGSLSLSGLTCDDGTTYTPTTTDDRVMSVTLFDGPTAVRTFDGPIKAVPFAIQATNSEMVGGYSAPYLMKVNPLGAHEPSRSFSTLGFSILYNLAEMPSVDFGGKALKGVFDPVDPQDVATKAYVDSQLTTALGTVGVKFVGAVSASSGVLNVTGGNITNTGTISIGFAQQGSGFLGAPSGGTGAPVFRSVTDSDITGLSAAKLTGTLGITQGGTGNGVYNNGELIMFDMLGNKMVGKGCNDGEVLVWVSPTGWDCKDQQDGSVTSVDLFMPSVFTVLGGPITSSGSFEVSLAEQNVGMIFAAPTGVTGQTGIPVFRYLEQSDIPFLDASKINAGTFNVSRIPDLDAAKIVSGTFNVARIPDLDAAKITSGTFNVLRIPDLDASKITTGTLGVARGGTGLDGSSATTGQLLMGNGTGGFSLGNLTGSSGIIITRHSGSINLAIDPLASGAVTNVGLTAPSSVFNVSNSPVTGAGTMNISFQSQAALSVFAAPTGASGTPSFRLLEAFDIPFLDASKISTGTFDVLRIPDLSAAKITSGTLAANRGGTGLDGSAATTGQLLIGNGTGGFALGNLIGSSGVIITNNAGSIGIAIDPNAAGAVTYVGAAVPNYMTVAPSGISSRGTFDFSFNSQNMNLVFAAPTGASGAPSFRALDPSDIPNLSAAKITSGTLAYQRGGTGLDGSAATTGQLLIGTGTGGFALGRLIGASGVIITNNSGSIGIAIDPLASGAVTNVGLTAPSSVFNIANSPVTGAGTMNITFQPQSALSVFAAPTGATGVPSFRALEAFDIPLLDASKISTGTFDVLRIPDLSAAKITSGTLAANRGGTGLDGSLATTGQLMIGTGTGGFALGNLIGASGVIITNNSGSIGIAIDPNAAGAVTYVGASVPNYMTVGPTGISSRGTFDFSFNSQNMNMVFAAPTGGSGAPSFRILDALDIPNLSAVKITSGTLAYQRGGTGLDGSLATTGQLMIGTGTGGFAFGNLIGSSGVIITNNSGSIGIAIDPLASGAVTNVGLTAPSSVFNITNSPVTGAGTMNIAFQQQAAMSVFAAPTGAIGTPTFRALEAFDIPFLDASKISTGTFDVLRIPDLSAAKITSGTLAYQRGGTGLDGSAATTGQLLIGTGTGGFALGRLIGASGVIITNNSGSIGIAIDPLASGAVTNVGFTAPTSIFTLSGSPVTGAGTIQMGLGTQGIATVLAAPTGVSGVPFFRQLQTSDITSGIFAVNRGGTGLDGSAAVTGQLLIGNGTGGFALGNLVGASGIIITNNAGSIGIAIDPTAAGAVTYVGATVPNYMSVAPSGISSSGTLAFNFNSQNANMVFAAPTGGSGAPAFRILDPLDIPNLSAVKITSGTLAFQRGGTGLDGSLAGTGQLMIGTGTGGFAFGNLVGASGVIITNNSGSIGIAIDPLASGAVTNVGFTAPTSIFTLTGSPVTGAGTIQMGLGTQGIAQVLAAPTGASGVPFFRALQTSDIISGIFPVQRGGIGLDGSAATTGQLLIGNGTGGFALGNLIGGAGVTITNNAGSISISSTSGTAGFVQGGNSFGTTGILGTNDAQAMAIRTNGSDRLFINSGGSIGIGTSAPQFPLDVAGLSRIGQGLLIGGTTLTTGASFEVAGTGPSASSIIVPRDSTANRPVTGVAGMIRYNTTLSKYEVYEGGQWMNLQTSTGTISGSVTNVGLTAPTSVFNVAGSSISGAGTFAITLGSQGIAQVFAAPTGSTGTPAFRNLAASDIYTGIFPVQRGGSGLDGSAATTGQLLIGNGTGGFALGNLTGGSGVIITNNAGSIGIAIDPLASGAVTNVGFTAPTSIFTLTGSPVTGAGTIQMGLGTQGIAQVLAAPVAASGVPSFRSLVMSDITSGTLGVDKGGTGLNAVSASTGQLLIANGTGGFNMGNLVGGAGVTVTNNSGSIQISTSGGTLGWLQGGNVFGQTGTLGTRDAQGLSLITNNTERFYIAPSGNIGIGTSTPPNALSIAKNRGQDEVVSFENFAAGRGAFLNITGISDYVGIQFAGTTGIWKFGQNGSPNLSITDAINNRDPFTVEMNAPNDSLRIKASGNVGLGTNNPQGILHLEGTTAANSALVLPVASTANRPTGIAGMIRYNTTLNKYEVYEAGQWINLQTSTGTISGSVTNVGLTAPTAIFNVAGSSISGAGTFAITLGSQGIAQVFAAPTGSTGTPVFRNLAASDIYTGIFPVQRGGIGLDGSAATTGQLLIGNGTGGFALGNLIGGAGVTITNNAGSISISSTSGTAGFVQGGNSFGTTGVLGTNDAQALNIRTNGTSRLFINSGGSIGVGNSSPAYPMDITGSTRVGRLFAGTLGAEIGDDGSFFRTNLIVGGTGITTGAAFEVAGTGSAASSMIVPRDSSANRPSTGVVGMLRYNTTLGKYEVYEGGQWMNLQTTTGTISGSVTNVGLTAPTSVFNVAGSSISGAGTFQISLGTQGIAQVFAAPTGASGVPSFRALVMSDITTGILSVDKGGTGLNAVSATTGQLLIANGTGGFNMGNLVGGAGVTITNSAGSISISSTSGTAGFVQGGNSFGAAGVLGTNDNQAMAIRTNGSNQVNITAAGQIGFGTASPTAMLDIASNGTLGSAIRIPQDTSANRPSAPGVGMLRYNSTLGKYEVYEAGQWMNLQTTTGTISGSVTNVGLTAPTSVFNVAGSSISGAGTFQISLGTQGIAQVFAAPTGASGVPSFRALVMSDITTGILATNRGGTGLNGSAATTGQLLIGNGTGGFNLGNIVAGAGVTVTNSAGSISISSTSGTAGFVQGGNSFGATGVLGTNDNQAMAIRTNGSNQVNITAAGQIGLGTSSPTAMLDIASNGTLGSAIRIPQDTSANRPSAPGVGMIRYNTTLGKYEVYEAGTWLNVQTTAGTISGSVTNVGLTAPSSVFNVAGSSISGAGTFAITLGTQGIAQVFAAPTGASGVPSFRALVMSDITTGILATNRGGTGLNGSVATTGQLLIGNGTGGFNLGNIVAGAGVTVTNTAGSISISSTSGTAGFVQNGNSFGTTGVLGTNDNQALAFRTNGTNRMTINAGGSVGIRTTPTMDFEVKGTQAGLASTIGIIGAYSSDAQNADVGASIVMGGQDGAGDRTFSAIHGRKENSISSNTAGYFAVTTRSAGGAMNEGMRVTSQSQVGIGTTIPTAILDIASNGTLGSAIRIPQDTSANRPSAPGVGMIRYNTTLGKYEVYEAGGWLNVQTTAGTVSGSVTNVGLTAPTSVFNVAGSSISGAGTFAITLGTQGIAQVFAAPTGASGVPSFRALIMSDITTGILATNRGGTGLNGSGATTGQLLIGNGTGGFNLGNIVGGAGVTVTNTAGSISISSTSGTAGFVQGGNSFGATGVLGTNDNQALAIRTNGTTRMSFGTAGQAAIGQAVDTNYGLTINTGTSLGVISARNSNPSGNSAIDFIDSSGSLRFATGWGNATSGFWINEAYMDVQGAAPFSIANSGVRRLTVASDGNVGIGTAAPSGILHLVGTTAANSALVLPVATSANRPTNAMVGMIRYNSTLGKYEVYEAGGWLNIQTTAGTVSGSVTNVGLTAPTSVFNVAGSSISGAGTFAITLGTQGIAQVFAAPTGASGVPSFRALIMSDITTGILATNRGGTGLNGSVATTGQLLIGNGTGGFNLGNIVGGTGVIVTNAAGSISISTLAGTTGFVQNGNSFGTTAVLGTNDTQALSFETAGTGRMLINSGGSVSIGGASPSKLFSIGSANNFTVDAAGNATVGVYNTVSTTPSQLIMGEFQSTGTTRPNIMFNGPYMWTGLGPADTNGGQNNLRIGAMPDGPGANWRAFNTPGATINLAIDGGLSVGTGVIAPSGGMIVVGNVGIGTAAPSGILHLVGTTSTNSALVLPVATSANRPTGQVGMIRYNSTTTKYEVYDGSAWLNVQTTAGTVNGTVTNVGLEAPTSVFNVTGSSISGAGTFAITLGTQGIAQVFAAPTGASGVPSFRALVMSDITTGILAVNRGGTGMNAATATTGQLLIANGTGGFNLGNIVAGAGVTVTNTAGSISISSTSGTLGWAQGGNSFGQTGTLGTNDNADLSFKTNNIRRVTVSNTGWMGIGRNAPEALLDVAGNGGSMYIKNSVYSNNPSENGGVLVERARGTLGGATQIQSGDRMGIFSATNAISGGYTGMEIFASQTHTAGAAGTEINFMTVANGGLTNANRMTISNNGMIGINTGGAPSAVLDIASNGTLGSAIRIPQDTSANRPFNPGTGMIRYNTTTSKYEVYDGSGWLNVQTTAGTISGTVTNVGLTAPTSVFNVTGSSISGAGTFAISLGTQGIAQVFAAPTGASGVPSFRALIMSDITTGILAVNRGGTGMNGSSATTGQLLIGNGTGGFNIGNIVGGAGVTVTNTAGSISISSISGTTGFVQGGNSFGQTGTLGTNDAQALAIETSGTTRISVGADGRTSITSGMPANGGVNSPLALYGNAGTAGTNYVQFYLENTNAGSNKTAISFNDVFRIGNDQNGNNGVDFSIRDEVANAHRFYIDSNGRIGMGTTAPSGILHLVGTTAIDSALVLPVATSANRPSGQVGMIRYNSTTSKYEVYDGSAWLNVQTTAGTISGTVTNVGLTAPTSVFNVTGSSISGAGTFAISLGTQGIAQVFAAPTGASGVPSFRALIMSDITTGILATNRGGTGLNGSVATTGQLLIGNGTGGFNLGNLVAGTGVTITNAAGSISISTVTGTLGWSQGGNSFASVGTLGTNDNNALRFRTNSVNRFEVGAGGGVAIGTTASNGMFQVLNHGVQILNNDAWNDFDIKQASPDKNSNLNLRRSRGTIDSPTYVQNGDYMGSFSFRNHLNADGAAISAQASQTHTSGVAGTRLWFEVVPNGSNAAQRAMIVENDGRVVFGTGTMATNNAIADFQGLGTLASSIILPRDTSANRPAAPIAGMMRYNTSTTKYEVYDGAGWLNVQTTAGTVSGTVTNVGLTAPTSVFNVTGSSISGAGTFAISLGTQGIAQVFAAPTGASGVPSFRALVMSDITTGILATNRGGTGLNGSVATTGQLLIGNGTGGFNFGNIVGGTGVTVTNTAGSISISTLAGTTGFAQNGNSFGTTAVLGTNDTQGLSFETAGTGRMFINSGGSIGIGTNSPQAKFEVWGSTQLNGSFDVYAGNSNLYAPTGGGPYGQIAVAAMYNNDATAGNAAGYLMSARNPTGFTSAYIAAVSPATGYTPSIVIGAQTGANAHEERMRFDSQGRLGVGTTAPSGILHLIGTTATNSAMVLPAASTALRPTGINGMIRYNTTNSKFEAYQAGAWTNMIGAGSATAAGSNTEIQFNSGGTLGASSNFFFDNTAKALVIEGANYSPGFEVSNTSSTGIQYPSIGVTNYSGSVGGYPIMSLTRARGTKGAPAGLQTGDTIGSFEAYGYGSSASDWAGSVAFIAAQDFSGSVRGTHLSFTTVSMGGTTGVEKMRITARGNIGVGISTPSAGALMDFTGTGTFASSILLPRDTSANRPSGVPGMIRYNTSNNKFEGYENAAWVNLASNSATPAGTTGYVQFNSAGTLGASANYTWDNSIRQLYINSLTGTAGIRLQNAATNTTELAVGLLQADAGMKIHSSTNQVALATANVDRLFVNNNGLIGIGTGSGATPGAIVNMQGSGTLSSSIIIPRDTTALRPSGINGMLRYNTSNAKFEGFEGGSWKDMIATGAGTLGWAQGGNSFAQAGTLGTNDNFPLSLKTNGSAHLNITATGSVGIGVASPTSKLNVGANLDMGLPGSYTLGSSIFRVTENGTTNLMMDGNTILTDANQMSLGLTTANSLFLVTNGVSRNEITGTGTMYQYGKLTVGAATSYTGVQLAIDGTGTAGSSMLIPRDTTALRPAIGINGMMRYNTSNAKFEGFEGGSWKDMIGNTGTLGFAQGGNSFGQNATLGTNDTFSLAFETAGTTRMTINSGGTINLAGKLIAQDGSIANPGIAFTTTPTTGFSLVSGSIETSIAGTNVHSFTPSGMEVSTSNNYGEYTVYSYGTVGANNARPFFRGNYARGTAGAPSHPLAGDDLVNVDGRSAMNPGNSSGAMIVRAEANFTASSQPTALLFATSSATVLDGAERMRITSKGLVGIGTSTPQQGALVDFTGTGTLSSSILIPRDTTALRPVGINGMMRYNTSNSKFEGFEAGSWKDMIGSSGTTGWSQGGNSFGLTGTLGTNDNFPLVLKTNNTPRMTLLAAGQVGIGTQNPNATFAVEDTTFVSMALRATNGATHAFPGFSIDAYQGSSYSGHPRINFQNSRGSLASPVATPGNLVLGNINFMGLGTLGVIGANVYASSEATFTNSSAPTSLYLSTTPSGSTSPVERLTVKSSGMVGVGTTAPVVDFTVTNVGDDSSAFMQIGNTGASPIGWSGLWINTSDNSISLGATGSKGWAIESPNNGYPTVPGERNDLQFSHWNGSVWATRMAIDSVTGNVGIGLGNNAPSSTLDVAGDIQYTGTITDVSDWRLKENITPLKNGLRVLRQIPVYSFTMKDDPDQRIEFGVIAQMVQKVVPELVKQIHPGKDDYLGVNYVGLIPWSIKAIQELDADVVQLKQENETLKQRMDRLEKQNQELADQVKLLIEMQKRAPAGK